MKFYIPLIIVLLSLLNSCQSTSIAPLQKEIDSIAKRLVPDKRVAICDISLVKGKGSEMVLKGESTITEAKTEIIQLLSSKGITVIDSVVILPDTIHLEKNWGIVSLSVANLRSKPAHSAEMVSQAIMGTPCRVLKEDDGWLLIQTPDLYIGWTNESSVQQMNREKINEWRTSERIIYTDTYGVISGDDKLSTVISDLVTGAIVIKKSEVKNISEVTLPDGRSGYVSNQKWLNLKEWKDTVNLIPEKMISTGERFLGFPYLWGGTSSKGLDCSGFVKTVCFLNGVILERDASQQYKHGEVIDVTSGWEKLKKGDLLFFGSKEPLRVTHVGMYIGESQFIHCSGSVRFNSFDPKKEDYSKHLSSVLVGAKRIIGQPSQGGIMSVKLHSWY
jgi:SH3-like domain-containing protein